MTRSRARSLALHLCFNAREPRYNERAHNEIATARRSCSVFSLTIWDSQSKTLSEFHLRRKTHYSYIYCIYIRKLDKTCLLFSSNYVKQFTHSSLYERFSLGQTPGRAGGCVCLRAVSPSGLVSGRGTCRLALRLTYVCGPRWATSAAAASDLGGAARPDGSPRPWPLLGLGRVGSGVDRSVCATRP